MIYYKAFGVKYQDAFYYKKRRVITMVKYTVHKA